MDWKQYITTDPSILHGAVCFVGTGTSVTVVLDNLANGAAPAEILRQYPGLRAEHVPAALATRQSWRASGLFRSRCERPVGGATAPAESIARRLPELPNARRLIPLRCSANDFAGRIAASKAFVASYGVKPAEHPWESH